MSYQSERDAFIAQFVKEGGSLADARAILRDAATLQRLAVTACNRELTPSEEKRFGHAAGRVEHVAMNFKADIGGDPRGYVVKLHFPSGAYNTWGGKESGYGVPTRRRF